MKNSTDSRRNWGFIAQDIQKLLGDSNAIVTVGQDDVKYLGLRYTDFVAPLVKAVQEQQAFIAALQLENAKLRADNSAIKADNSAIKTDNIAIKTSLNTIMEVLNAQGVNMAELRSDK